MAAEKTAERPEEQQTEQLRTEEKVEGDGQDATTKTMSEESLDGRNKLAEDEAKKQQEIKEGKRRSGVTGELGKVELTGADAAEKKLKPGEHKNPDGSQITVDASGHISKIVDAKGVTREFKYNTEGQVIEVTEPSGVWKTTDGKQWTNEKGQKWDGLVKIPEDGRYQFSDLDGKVNVSRNPNGSEVTTDKSGNLIKVKDASGVEREFKDGLLAADEKGRITRMVNANAVAYEFKYGPDGKVSEVKEPSGHWKTTDGKHWVNEKGEKWDGTVNVTDDGNYRFSDLKGEVNVSRNPNGSEVTTDKEGKIVKTINANGVEREYTYGKGPDGKPMITGVKEPTGDWKTTDGRKWTNEKGETWTGSIAVAKDGSYIYQDARATTIEQMDSKELKVDRSGGVVVRGRDGKIEKTIDAAKQIRTFGYDAKGELNKVTDEKGVTWETKDGETWTAKDGSWWKGTITLDKHGTGKEVDINGKETIRKTDGTITVKDTDGRITLTDREGKTTEIQPPVDPEKIKQLAAALRKESGATATVKALSHTDREKVFNLLKDTNEAERKELKRVYKETYGLSLSSEYSFLDGSDKDKFKALLNKKDGDIATQNAYRIKAAISEHHEWSGRSKANCEKDIRDTLASMNSEQMEEADAHYRSINNGASLHDAIMNDPKLSQATKDMCAIYLKGNDKRSDDDTLKLADIAIKEEKVDMFEEAMRDASPEARKKFMDEGGEKKLKDAFEGHWYNVIPYAVGGTLGGVGGLFVASKISGNVTDQDLKHVMDYAKEGKLSATTQIKDNTGIIDDNEKAIEMALSRMTDQERKDYARGKELTVKNEAATTEADKKAVAYYKELSEAIKRAGNAAEIGRWEDMITHKGGSLVARLATHNGIIYNDSRGDVLKDVENMTESEWEYMRKNPEYRKEVEKALKELKGIRIDQKDIDLALDIYDRKLASKTFKDSQGMRRSLSDALDDDTHWYRNDRKAMLQSIVHMTEAEQKKYRDDPEFKKKLDAKVKDCFGDDPGMEAAQRLLGKVAKGEKLEDDVITKLYLRAQERRETDIKVTAGSVALAPIGFGVLTTEIGADTLTGGHARGAFFGSEAAAAVRDIQDEFKKHPELREKLLNPKTEEDRKLSEQFHKAAHAAMNDIDFNKYVKPLLEKGELPMETQMALNRSVFKDDEKGTFQDLTKAGPQEKDKILTDKDYQEKVLGHLSDDDRKIALNALRQGKMEVEDNIRYNINHSGGSSDIMTDLRKLTPEQFEAAKRAYAAKYKSDLESDLLSKLDGDQRKEMIDLFRKYHGSAEAHNDARDRYLDSRDGFGSWLAESVGQSGVGYQLDDIAHQYTREITEAHRSFKDLPAEKQKELHSQLTEALKNWKESKGAAAQYTVDAIIAVIAVAGAAYTGGQSLWLIALIAAGAGAVANVGVKGAVLGSDYDWDPSEVAKDILVGAVDGATSVIGLHEAAAIFKIGQKAGTVAAERAFKQLAEVAIKEGAEKVLAKGAKEVLEEGMVKIMRNSITQGAKNVDEKAIKALAEKAVAKELTGEARELAIKQVTQTLQKELQDSLAKEARSFLRQTLLEVQLNMAGGTMGGGAGGLTRGLVNWDSSLSVEQNLKRVAESTASSAAMGGIAAGAMTIGMKGLKAGWDKATTPSKTAPPEMVIDGKPVNVNNLDSSGNVTLIGREQFPGHPDVAPNQVSLTKDANGRLFIMDTGTSEAGTWLKQEGSNQFRKLKPGEVVELGAKDKVRLGSAEGPELHLREGTRVAGDKPLQLDQKAKEDVLKQMPELQGLSPKQKEALFARLANDPMFKPDVVKGFTDKAMKAMSEMDGLSVPQRVQKLQEVMDKLADEQGLPKVKIEAVPDAKLGAGAGDYGEGVIRIKESDLAGNPPSKVKLVERLYHEMTHNRQDTLVVRSIADELNIGKTATPDQAKEIQDLYRQRTKGDLPADYLDKVLKTRNGQPLSAVERDLATEAAEAFKKYPTRNPEYLRAEADHKVASQELQKFGSSNPEAAKELTKRLAQDDGRLSHQLFGSAEPPADVKQLMNKLNSGNFSQQEADNILQTHLRNRTNSLYEKRLEAMAEYYRNLNEQEAYAIGRRAQLEAAHGSPAEAKSRFKPGETTSPELKKELKEGIDMDDAPEVVRSMRAKEDPVITVPMEHLDGILATGYHEAHPNIQGHKLLIGTLGVPPLQDKSRFTIRVINPDIVPAPRATGADNQFHGVVSFNPNKPLVLGRDIEIILPDGTVIRDASQLPPHSTPPPSIH